jgi:hypothetical protein
MKKFIILLPILASCTETININYENTGGGCVYSEELYDDKLFSDKYNFSVNYSGVKCETIINHELKNNIHKTPYNGIPAIIENPPMKIDVSK